MIRILEQSIADKIAAGEVITGPVAVVKELVENAIDAGATAITVEIKAGGKEYIRVTDNGSGIPSGEVELAFQKHATGKIVTEEDLANIGTLGFRGEALGSIATVSDLEMVTRTAEETVGTRLYLKAGEVAEKKAIGCEVGTTVTVMHLFYNTPARLKFLRTDRGEGALVFDFLSKAAIAYPHIRMQVVRDGKVLFHTKGNGDGLQAILAVYGGALKGKLIPVEAENADGSLALRAYIADPMESRPTRKMQIFFVNGRLVHDRTMEEAVAAAYKGRLFAGRYPVVFLFLETTPDKLDVNIHPSKDRIRFYDSETIGSFIAGTLEKGLLTEDAVPELHLGAKVALTKDATSPVTKPPATRPADDAVSAAPQRADEPAKKDSYAVQDNAPSAADSEQVDIKTLLSEMRKKDRAESAHAIAETPVSLDRPFDFRRLTPKGIFFDTYIAAADEDAVYLIDQHAAHERVLYEQIRRAFREKEGESQLRLTPETFDLPPGAEDILPPLEKLGFSLEEFGPSTYLVRAVPLSMAGLDIKAFLLDFAEGYTGGDIASEELRDRIATMACKAAVKGHDRLTEEEVLRLLQDLADCDNPFSCPHGRPTFLRMTKGELERNFKRA